MKIWMIVLGLFIGLQAQAQEGPRLKNQSLYVPIYSHIYYGNKLNKGHYPKTQLSALVSVRNIDPKRSIRVLTVKYYDTHGKFLRDHLSAPVLLPPFGTQEFFIEAHDESGGSGANFLIRWESDEPVNPPLVQAIHANMDSGKATIITTHGIPIAP